LNNPMLAASLNAEEIAEFQLNMTQLLSEEIPRFNHEKSSSIRVEQAQSLLESMLYGVSAYLQTVPDPALVLKTQSVRTLWEAGVSLLEQAVKDCQTLLDEVKATRVPTELIAYNHTIDHAFGNALSPYDPRYAAHETPGGLIDYPLYRDDMSVTGILYIKNYLTQLLKENRFCAGYRENYIRALLLTHGVKHHLDYREMLINLPELILEDQGIDPPKWL